VATQPDLEEQQRIAAKNERRNRLRTAWESLTEEQRTAIRDKVAETSDATVRRFIAQGKLNDPLVEHACFDELERRSHEFAPSH
jgi:hypothetical protein